MGGVERVKAKAEKDGKEGFVSLTGNQGSVYLEGYNMNAAGRKRAEQALQDLNDEATKVHRILESKTSDLRSVRSGPLEETRNNLQQMRPRVQVVYGEISKLKWKIEDAERKYRQAVEEQMKKRQEAIEKKAANALIEECTSKVNAIQETVEKVLPNSETLVKTKGVDKDNPREALADAEKELDEVVESIKQVIEWISDVMSKEGLRGNVKGPYAEARSTLVKLKVKVGGSEQRCKKQIAALKAAHKQVATEVHAVVSSLLGRHVQSKELKADALFKELSKGGVAISSASLCKFVKDLPDAKPNLVDIALERYSSGISELSFLAMAQDFYKC